MQKCIVVCDDDNWTREFVKDFLGGLNCQVHAFENGLMALDFLKTNAVDLVVSDINMPKMSGIQLIEQMYLMKLKVPTIFLTGVMDPNEIVKAYSFNYFEYINKPINPFDLKEAVEKALINGYQESMFSEEFIKRLQKKVS